MNNYTIVYSTQDDQTLVETVQADNEPEAVQRFERDNLTSDILHVVQHYVPKLTLNTEVMALLVEALEECRFALEPYDDIKPRDWKTDRERLRRAHEVARAALAKARGVLTKY